MGWIVVCGLALAGLSGCGASPAPGSSPSLAAPNPKKLDAIDLETKSRLSLTTEKGRLRVGDSAENARFLFPAPPKAEDQTSLPFDLGDDVTAEGWERDDEGFSVILVRDVVALALWVQPKVGESEFNDLIDEVTLETGRSAGRSIITEKVQYRFWTDGIHRLMICTTKNQDQTLRVTMALGHSEVMNRLRMNPELAAEDTEAANRILKNGKISEPNKPVDP